MLKAEAGRSTSRCALFIIMKGRKDKGYGHISEDVLLVRVARASAALGEHLDVPPAEVRIYIIVSRWAYQISVVHIFDWLKSEFYRNLKKVCK